MDAAAAIDAAMKGALRDYVLEATILLIAVIVLFCASGKKEANLIPAIALLVCFIWLCINLYVPFYRDYTNDNIIQAEGTYINNDKAKSPSGNAGMYSVSLQIGDKKIHLTTIPHNKDVFLHGEYYVKAYYTGNSKMLVYIEILRVISEAE